MKEIVNDVLQLLESGQDFALVRLVAEQGSTPRQAGAEMLVRRDGSIAGTIGGGLLEATMMRAAAERTGAPAVRDDRHGAARHRRHQRRRDDLRRQRRRADRLRPGRRPGSDRGLHGAARGCRRAASRLAVHRAARRRGRRRRALPAARRRHDRRRPTLRARSAAHRRRQDRRARYDQAARRARGAGRDARSAGHGHHLRRRPRGPGPGAGRGPRRLAHRGARRSRGVRQPPAVPGRPDRPAVVVRRRPLAGDRRRAVVRGDRHPRAHARHERARAGAAHAGAVRGPHGQPHQAQAHRRPVCARRASATTTSPACTRRSALRSAPRRRPSLPSASSPR